MKEKNINNIQDFATELGEIVGQHIGVEHIHPSTEGRYYYIQAPKEGAPMLLNHYRGPFFVDIHPDDYNRIANGEISAHDYIFSANWQIGYYWGGGSMIGGGYYQPFDIVGRQDEVRRYLKILSCHGKQRVSGYVPTEKQCTDCTVENCPHSKYKKGNRNEEMPETDPRRELFFALFKRFEKEYPGYTLRGFLCGKIPDGEIWLSPNGYYSKGETFAFTVYASDSVIQSLLMHEIVPESWEEYAEKFTLCIFASNGAIDATPKNVYKAFKKANYTRTLCTWERIKRFFKSFR